MYLYNHCFKLMYLYILFIVLMCFSLYPLVSVRFDFFREKTGLARFDSVFFGLTQFFRFGLVFLVWLVLARFFFVSVRFFWFFTYKTETEPASFFKILIGLICFFQFGFYKFFFYFLSLINFLIFCLSLVAPRLLNQALFFYSFLLFGWAL